MSRAGNGEAPMLAIALFERSARTLPNRRAAVEADTRG